MEQRDEEMGRREENRGPERASESEEIDRTLEQIMDNQKQEKKKRPGKKKWILAAGILGLGILGIKMVTTGGSQTPVVAVIPLEKQDIQEKLSISGPVSGTDSVDVVSNIHAEILQMNVKEGDKVIKGQALAVLDRTELEREVNIARNAYEQAVANKEAQDKEAALGYEKAVQDFQKASTDHDRNSQLFAAGDISQADMEQSANALNDARRAMEKYTVENGRGVSDRSYGLQVENAAYELEKKQEELEKTEIKSEIDGTVVRVNSKVGQFADKVEDDKPIFSIENLDQLELEVRRMLTEKLMVYKPEFLANMEALGHLDLIVAKGKLALRYHCVRPSLSADKSIALREVVHPQVAEDLAERGEQFTSLDLELRPGCTVITGANMGGKTVSLRSTVLSLLLCQCGFFVFAKSASLPLFHRVDLILADSGPGAGGLSSFGKEVHLLDTLLRQTRDCFFFVAMDEFARGTNPQEGAALARALVRYLGTLDCVALMTTHYDGVSDVAGAHYQVAGLVRDIQGDEGDDPRKRIARRMDYHLLPAPPGAPCPRDALRVCRLLKLDDALMDLFQADL